MRRTLRRYPSTLVAALILTVSFGFFGLGASGALPADGFWRVLVVPAWLTLTAGAIIRTALPAASGVPDAVVVLGGIGICLLPFVTVDWLIGRRRNHAAAPAT
jgi:hypothetical protein